MATEKLLGALATVTYNLTGDRFYLGKFKSLKTGVVSEIRTYGNASGYIKAGIYANNAGVPGERLGYNNNSQPVAAYQWNTLTIEPTNVVQDEDYWLAFNVSGFGVGHWSGATGGTCVYKAENYTGFAFPNPAGPGFTPSTRELKIEGWGVPTAEPTTTAQPVDEIQPTSAKLHGTLTDDGGEPCSVKFVYGIKPAENQTTEWQEGKVTDDTFEAIISDLIPETDYICRAVAKNSAGETTSEIQEFTTSAIPPIIPPSKKLLITHAAIKRVTVYRNGNLVTSYDNLSNLNEERIESGLEIPITTPATIEVVTLTDRLWTFDIPP